MENCLYLYFEIVLRKNRIYYIYIEENKIHQVLNFKKILRWPCLARKAWKMVEYKYLYIMHSLIWPAHTTGEWKRGLLRSFLCLLGISSNIDRYPVVHWANTCQIQINYICTCLLSQSLTLTFLIFSLILDTPLYF